MRKRLGRALVAGLLCGLTLAPVGGSARAATDRMDLNTASAIELQELPGIGAAKARAIVEHRSASPFTKPEELRDVKGIGDALFERLRDRITVGKPAPSSSRGG